MRRYFLVLCCVLLLVPVRAARSEGAVEFLQVTDTHVVDLKGVAPRLAAAREHFQNSGKALAAFLSGTAPKYHPAFILITGDLIDAYSYAGTDGKTVSGQIEAFRQVCDGSPVPLRLALGNHDIQHYGFNSAANKLAPDQSVAGEARAAWIGTTPYFRGGTYYEFEASAGATKYVFLVLDDGYSGTGNQFAESKAGFRMADEQLQWIRRQVTAHRDDPVILALHVPLDDSAASQAIGAAAGVSGNVVLAIAGHKHSDAIQDVPLGAHSVVQVRTAAFGYGETNWRRLRLSEDRIEVFATGKPNQIEKTIRVHVPAPVH
jgi:3',5'-cyclic AMP phosphodiesterase CpdA